MVRKYYARFIYNYGKQYVVMFKIRGSLAPNEKSYAGSFMDKDIYCRSIEQVLAIALDRFSVDFQLAGLLSHEQFVKLRADGVERWPGEVKTINWD